MELILAGIIGFLGVTIIDRVWFLIDYKKAEKGLEVLEHYHYLFIAWIGAFLIVEYIPVLAYGLIGAGTAFFYHEAKQKNFFSYTSTHFKQSTIIGVVLAAITIAVYLITPLYLN